MPCTTKTHLTGLEVPLGNNGRDYQTVSFCPQLTTTSVPATTSIPIYLFSTENNFLFQTEEGFRIDGVGLGIERITTFSGSVTAINSADDEIMQMENGVETFVLEFLL